MAWPTLSAMFTYSEDDNDMRQGGHRSIKLARLPQRLTKTHKLLAEQMRSKVVDLISYDGEPLPDYQAWQRVVLKFWSSAGARELKRVDELAVTYRKNLGVDTGEPDNTLVYSTCHGLWELACRPELHLKVHTQHGLTARSGHCHTTRLTTAVVWCLSPLVCSVACGVEHRLPSS